MTNGYQLLGSIARLPYTSSVALVLGGNQIVVLSRSITVHAKAHDENDVRHGYQNKARSIAILRYDPRIAIEIARNYNVSPILNNMGTGN